MNKIIRKVDSVAALFDLVGKLIHKVVGIAFWISLFGIASVWVVKGIYKLLTGGE